MFFVGISEKGQLYLRTRARGPGQHPAIPRPSHAAVPVLVCSVGLCWTQDPGVHTLRCECRVLHLDSLGPKSTHAGEPYDGVKSAVGANSDGTRDTPSSGDRVCRDPEA